ncbi:MULTISPECIES: Fur-regulated basic protein FbpA [unclassified Bacillus (in: firmicutes)]|uniref:Fur-regulated basic protein FbpA n=1 Tax=unclassified Bacillus (in: firmicutes) TaxID=185979 RepID=UPI001BEA1420|nr:MULTISPECIES: Fur-regulated basic protein FbpA [unclassified Bacillus (in: firmicutes)]MBT2637996.1 Fur-regulated basic protein FbpA [Bacillus sp. ISL-39]MBT2661171.1 Fur-regulated basic protein FbpA [Bacillus sp. ISL-45]
MSFHLRSAIEKLKDHYIRHLLTSGITDETEENLKKMTITELQNICNGLNK